MWAHTKAKSKLSRSIRIKKTNLIFVFRLLLSSWIPVHRVPPTRRQIDCYFTGRAHSRRENLVLAQLAMLQHFSLDISCGPRVRRMAAIVTKTHFGALLSRHQKNMLRAYAHYEIPHYIARALRIFPDFIFNCSFVPCDCTSWNYVVLDNLAALDDGT